MPAAVPQMMLCLIKFMKHTVIWHSAWRGKHNFFVVATEL